MKIIIYAALMVTTLGCSTLIDLEAKKEFEGVERVQIGQEDYQKPQFYIENFKFDTGRSIASVVEDNSSQDIIPGRVLSNRELYFLTYYKQHLTLGKSLGHTENSRSCPSFHGAILDHKKYLTQSASTHSSKVNLEKLKSKLSMVTKYPIVAIPFSDQADLFSVLIQNDFKTAETYVNSALENYYQVQKREIATLCDKGVSGGYYIYENLVSHFKQSRDFHKTTAGLKALLKVPVIANMLILDNLEQNPVFSLKTDLYKFENILLNRSRISWFREYRESLKEQRKEIIGARKFLGSRL